VDISNNMQEAIDKLREVGAVDNNYIITVNGNQLEVCD